MKLKSLRGIVPVLLGVALVLASSVSVQAADNQFQIAWTKIGIYPHSSPTMSTSARSGRAVSDGTWITVACETTGETVTSDVATNNIWERTADGSYYPNVFVNTRSNGWTTGIPRCSALDQPLTASPAPGNGQSGGGAAAAQWAANHHNETQLSFMSECTILVSRALWAAGVPQTKSWTNATKDRNLQGGYSLWNGITGRAVPSKAATVAETFVQYAADSGLGTKTAVDWNDNTAGGAALGDVIAYDWEGDGHIDHLALVTSLNDQGYPSVTQRTPAQLNRYWSWSLESNDWIASPNVHPNAKVYLVKIHY
ncbi:amidase domain-containing protein [Microbacterium sp.]|uniref:amidase domain-containing protein n=1 Tax=Microbacterium sp. TaxID=51671 RepID=UPI0039E46406